MNRSRNSDRFIQLLGSIRDHLRTHPAVGAVASVSASRFEGGCITVQLEAVELVPLAAGLLAWANTIGDVTAAVWRIRVSGTMHLRIVGHLRDLTWIEVYGGVPHSEAVFGDLQPGGRQSVALSVLRAWANGEAVTS
jgi:hypothetical protein